MTRYLRTTCGRVAMVTDDRVIVMDADTATRLMLDHERVYDRLIAQDPADEWGIAACARQCAQAIGEALLALHGVSGRSA